MRALNGERLRPISSNHAARSLVFLLTTQFRGESERGSNVRWYLRLLGISLFFFGVTRPALAQVPGAEPTCGDYGTSVHFEKSPKDAAKKALKEEKLVMVLHISGLFEEPDYT
jgi:hypothetical protein